MEATPQDLTRASQLRRLLTPEEVLVYTVRFHYLRGWGVLLAALACFGASYVYPVAMGPFLLLLGLWYLPLKTNEIAVTNDRLLMRTGWLKLRLEAIEDEKLIRWELNQGLVGSLVNAGTVTLIVREVASTRELVVPWVAQPVTFLEALQAMQDEKYRKAQ
jgi:uncharacterized membrane protein YdbT with pleckstrin-like domain